jgi:hypothetical protein
MTVAAAGAHHRTSTDEFAQESQTRAPISEKERPRLPVLPAPWQMASPGHRECVDSDSLGGASGATRHVRSSARAPNPAGNFESGRRTTIFR